MKKIVLTNEKGGAGKSTLACLMVEYLNYQGKKVQLIDTDPLQSSQKWAENCKVEGRQINHFSPEFQVIDTAGSSGSALGWLAQADLIVVPLRVHYADLVAVINWFTSLKKNWQEKIILVPNYWQNTREQRDGLEQLDQVVKEEKAGKVSKSKLGNRPALYGVVLNGSKENFFKRGDIPTELKELTKEIITLCEK